MTAFVSFDRVFEVLDAPEPDRGPPRRRPARAAGRAHRARRRVVPLPGGRPRSRSRRSRPTSTRPLGNEASAPVLRGIDLRRRAGPDGRAGRTVGRRQDHAHLPRPPALRPDAAAPCASTATTCATSPRTACRQAIGVVSQDPHLFHDTVGANLRYARPDATDDELEAACRAARIHDVIAALPDGYDTDRRRARATGCRAARSSGSPSPGCC